MAQKTRQLGEKGDLSAPPGSEPWAVAVRGQLMVLLGNADSSVRSVQLYLKKMEDTKGYTHLRNDQGDPFASIYDFAVARPPFGLGEELSVMMGILAETEDMMLGHKRLELQGHGGDRKSEAYQQTHADQGSDTTLNIGRGVAYLTARLARDCPDILQRLQAGDYSSVRAAAKAAGLIKDPTPLQRVQTVWRQATPEAREAIGAWITDQLAAMKAQRQGEDLDDDAAAPQP